MPPSAARTCETVGPPLRSLAEPTGANNCLLGGKYEIKRKIELYKGSVSTVYKCLLAGGAPVVVKTYHKAKMADKHFHKLEREVAAMRSLCREVGKKGIVQLFDTFEDAHGIYLVMECCEGGDLFKRLMLHGGKMSEHWVCVEVIAPLLRVLERMHELHIIHRDIKPENIFISADGEVKLGDFGLAIDSTKELPFCRSGTLDYMAPEVLLNPATHTQESPAVSVPQLLSKNIRPYTSAVDVWAVGCLAYELVCGRPPFEVEDEKQTASLIIYSNTIHFDPNGSAAWADFVTQALIKDPRQRPDAATLLGHSWIRSNLERAALASGVGAGVSTSIASRSSSVAAAVAAVTGGSAAHPSEAAVEGSRSKPGRTGSGVQQQQQQQQVGSAGGSSAVGSSSMCGSGSTALTADSSSASVGASSGGGASMPRFNAASPTTTTANGFRTAAAMLATRASQQQGCSTPTPPVGGAPSASPSQGHGQGHTSSVMYGGAPASAPPPQQRTRSSPASPSPGPAGHLRASNLASSGALRSLLDAFKAASLNTTNGASGKSSSHARPPSAGSGGVNPNSASSLLRMSFQFQLPTERRDSAGGGGGGGGSGSAIGTPTATGSASSSTTSAAAAAKLLRSSFQVQLPTERDRERERERDVSLGGLSTTAVVGCKTLGAPPRDHLQPTPETSARCGAAAAAPGASSLEGPGHPCAGNGTVPPLQNRPAPPAPTAGAANDGGVSGGGFTSPQRMARGAAATTGGLTGPAAFSSPGPLLGAFLRPAVSISTAGGCAGTLTAPLSPQPSEGAAGGFPAASAASPGGGHLGKPPRPQSESPGKVFARAAAAVVAQCGASSPLRRPVHPSPPRPQPSASPPRQQPQSVQGQPSPTSQRGDWPPGAAGSGHPSSTSAATLHDLTRSWGAVVSISVGKYAPQAPSAGAGVSAGFNGRGSGSGSAFNSPQRSPVGKMLDTYGLPAPTPVASGLPPAEYCSPRPSGVLERVKYHLRGGGGGASAGHAAVGGGAGTGAQGGGQHQQQHQQAVYGSLMLNSAPLATVDVM